MSEIHSMINLGEELQRVQDAAGDLWTWLPSYAECQKHHKFHEHSFTPSIDLIIREACHHLANLKTGSAEDPEWFQCPCGEDHEAEDTNKVNLREELMKNRNPCFLCQNAKGHHIQNLANFEYLLCMKSVNIDTCTYMGSCQDFMRVNLDDEVKRLEWADEFSARCNNS